MINPKYYDEKTGELLPTHKWRMAFNREHHPTEHRQARIHAAGFTEHRTIEPFDAYIQKFNELVEKKLRPIEFEFDDEVFEINVQLQASEETA